MKRNPLTLEAPKVIWQWCPACQTRTDQVYDHHENDEEVWICLTCCRFHKEVVK